MLTRLTDDNGEKLSTSNTRNGEHTYTIDWQPDYISWAIDGNVGRTVYKNDTYNSTDHKYHFPQTPSRVQLSLWPAGLPSNGQGTITWAGGLINWDSPYMQNGYYYAVVKEVSVECYDPPSGVQQSGDKAYYYTSTEGTEQDVAIGNNSTELASFLASGDQPDLDPSASANTDSSSRPTKAPETVPGISGGGSQQISGQDDSSEASASGSAPGGSPTGDSSFTQGGGMSQASSTVVASSAVALLGFIVAALLI